MFVRVCACKATPLGKKTGKEEKGKKKKKSKKKKKEKAFQCTAAAGVGKLLDG